MKGNIAFKKERKKIMNKFKRQIALLLTFCMILSPLTVNTKVSAHKKEYHAKQKEVLVIENYLTFDNNQFTIDSLGMLRDGIDKKNVKQICKEYKEINKNLATSDSEEIEKEKQQMLENLGPTERGKLGTAVKVIKKFLKEKWPKIIRKLPKPVRNILTADAILAVIDAYVEISDTVEELLSYCVNAILPKPLEVLTPGVVAVIMMFLPI